MSTAFPMQKAMSSKKRDRRQAANSFAKADRGAMYSAYAARHEGVPLLPPDWRSRLSQHYFEACEPFPSLYANRWIENPSEDCPQLKRWILEREEWVLQKQYMELAEQQALQNEFDPSSPDDSDEIDESLKRIRVQDTGHMWHNPFQSIF